MTALAKRSPCRILKKFVTQFRSIAAFFVCALCVAFPVGANEVPVDETQKKAKPVANPMLGVLEPIQAKAFLRESGVASGAPKIFVGRYNASEGLLVGFQSESGKRLLFRSRSFAGLGTSGQVLHFDPAAGKIVQLVGRSKSVDQYGKRVNDVSVGGTDIRDFMKSSKQKANGHAEKELRLDHFVKSEAGSALLDGIPALYAALEGLEDEPTTTKLLEPFGSVALALQLSSKQFRGLKGADQILGTAKATELSQACGADSDCALRGKSFTVHKQGLFDPLSKHFGTSARKSTSSFDRLSLRQAIAARHAELSPVLGETLGESPLTPPLAQARLKNGNGTCDDMQLPDFGACGLGSWAPGDFRTPQCFGHDYCVCSYGHTACMNDVPEGCGAAQYVTCYNLWDAAGSWFVQVWDMIGEWWSDFIEWIESWFENDDDDCPPGTICQN